MSLLLKPPLLLGSLGSGKGCLSGGDFCLWKEWACLSCHVEDGSISCRSFWWTGCCLGLNIPNSGSLGPLAHPTLFPSSSPVRQYADICLFNTAQYKCPVAMEEAE